MLEHLGDGSGLLDLENGKSVHIGESLDQVRLGSNIQSDEQSKLYLPPTVYVEKTVTSKGAWIGVEHLYSRGITHLAETGYSKCSTSDITQGLYNFYSVTVLNGGYIYLDDDDMTSSAGLLLKSHFIHLEHTGQLRIIGSAEIQGVVVEIEKLSTIYGDSFGYPYEKGPGKGQSCGPGSGGGNGGKGGKGRCSGCSCSCEGGRATYENKCLPQTAGAGGGTSGGGKGGSVARIVTSEAAFVEGTVTAKGATSSSAGGGGSGGTIVFDSDVLEGWGYIHAVGGNAGSRVAGIDCSYHGGGGGGGRIRTYSSNYTNNVLLCQRSVAGGSGPGGNGETGTLCHEHSNLCSGYGSWNNSCTCYTLHSGVDCQYRCDCGHDGTCDNDGMCECSPGFVGFQCESQCNKTTSCSDHGECTPCGDCVCDACYHGDNCSSMCSGAGQCDADQCQCDACHLGEFCESTCNDHGVCNVNGAACDCDVGWAGDKCTIKTCPGLHDVPCSAHGYCHASSGQCYCSPGWEGKKIYSYTTHFI